jgi:hypothetical protein
VRDGVYGRKLVTSLFSPSERDGRSISRVSDVLRAGSVSARSWEERVTTEHTGHTEKREESRELISFSFFIRESLLGVLGALRGSKKP